MASYLRKNTVRVSVVAVLAGAVLTAIAGLIEAWNLTVVAAAGTVGALAVLVVALARRQLRATNRSEAEVVKAIRALHFDVNRDHFLAEVRDRVLADVADVRSAVDASSRAIGVLREGVSELDGALAKLSDAHHRGTRTTYQKISQIHREVLTDTQAVHQLMRDYAPVEPLPPLAGWALSPSGLVWLTRHVANARPSTVVECGSGTSTVWSAMALRANGMGHLTALDHNPEFAKRTRDALERHGLNEWATVVDAPLTAVQTPRGPFDWYDIAHQEFGEIELLLVDGPPAATGSHARYPALPVFAPHLADGAVIVVDDMVRSDEREAVGFWLAEFDGLTDWGEVVKDIALLKFARE